MQGRTYNKALLVPRTLTGSYCEIMVSRVLEGTCIADINTLHLSIGNRFSFVRILSFDSVVKILVSLKINFPGILEMRNLNQEMRHFKDDIKAHFAFATL